MSDAVCFAPIPFRALCDERLTRADLAVLGIVAAHDRFARNGRGCDAGRERIAHLAGLDVATTSRAIQRLEGAGYITSALHAQDRRRRVYCVVYTDGDKSALKAETNPTNRKKVTAASPKSPEIGDAHVIKHDEIGDIENRQVADSDIVFVPKIFCETERRYSAKREEIHGNVRDLHRASPRPEPRKRSVSSHLCQIERELKDGGLAPAGARRVVESLWDRATCSEEREQASRILDEICTLEGSQAEVIDLAAFLERESAKAVSPASANDFEMWSPMRRRVNERGPNAGDLNGGESRGGGCSFRAVRGTP